MDGFDVAGRLSEGEPILDDLVTYVAACEALGHLSSGLDLRQLYSAETGLDLHALAADHRSLSSAADVAEHALSMQDNASRSLADSWSGTGGASAIAFAARQTGVAHALVAGLRRSADALAALRDDLARAVDSKVEAVMAAGEQCSEVWTAAARTVLGGGGDQAVASEIVDQQVKPFVDSVVCGEVTVALKGATNSAANSYDSAISVVRGVPVTFELPGVWSVPSARPVEYSAPIAQAPQAPQAPQAAAAIGSAATAPTIPAAFMAAAPAAAPAAPAGPPPESTLPMSAPAPAPAPAAGPGDLGIGSAAGGLGQQLSDTIRGVLGSVAGLAPDATALGDGADLTDDSQSADDTTVDEKKSVDKDQAAEEDPKAESSDEAESDSEPETIEPQSGPEPDPAPTQEPAPVPPEPPVEQPESVSKTPCQIAADELPQVGD